MTKVLVSLFLGVLLMVSASHDSYAETCGPIGYMGKTFQEECMPMPPLPRDHNMGKMERVPDAEHPMWRHLMDLDLSANQKAEAKEIRHRVMKEMIKKRAEECIAGIEMKELIDKDPVDMRAVEAKLKQIETLKTEMQLSIIRAIEEAKSKLTPEQKKEFKKMREIASDIGPPMMRDMMHGRMIMPPPPPEKQ